MPAIVLWVVSWVACAIAAYFTARSRSATNAPTWAAVGFLLGPIGIVLALVGARAPESTVVPLSGRALAVVGCLSFLAIAAWMVIGFAFTVLVAWPLQASRGENDAARTYIGLGALGAGAAVAIVGIVMTLRAVRRRSAEGQVSMPPSVRPTAGDGGTSSEPGAGNDGRMDAVAAPPKRRSGVRRIVIIGGLVAALLFVGYVGLSFLGAQVLEQLRGTVEFGTGGSGCNVEGRASTFPAGGAVYAVAHLTREVPAGTVVTFRVAQNGTEVGSVPRTFDAAGDCVIGTLPGAALTPAHYRVEYLAGSETLAAGEFDIALLASSGTSPVSPAASAPSALETAPCFDAASGGEPPPSEDQALEARLPDAFNGVRLCKGSFRGNTILGSSPSADELALLGKFSKNVDDYTMAIALDPTDKLPLSFGAIQLAGVDGGAFLKAYVSSQRANSGGQVSEARLGGKTVTTMTGSSGTTYIYANGDTLFYVLSSDPKLAVVGLAALP